MDEELIETLRIIIDRYGERKQGSVFIRMEDFPWYNERNGQLNRLYQEGMIVKPMFYDDGARITLTQQGRKYFEKQKSMNTLTKDQMIKILDALAADINTSYLELGYKDRKDFWFDLECLYKQNLLGLQHNPLHGGADRRPSYLDVKGAFVTARGHQFLRDNKTYNFVLEDEMISACAKIADNPVSYLSFDEDGLNRAIRDLLGMILPRYGYAICDQTQQGISEKKPGELDIRITVNGLPFAIYEGLIHRTKQYLYEHIDKAIGRYNFSGCKKIYIFEFSRDIRFGEFWSKAVNNVKEHPQIEFVEEKDTGLFGVKMLQGRFKWESDRGEFCYIGVNCYSE